MTNLAATLYAWRVLNHLSVREAGEKIGLTAATYFRVENGKEMNGQTLAKVISWLLTV